MGFGTTITGASTWSYKTNLGLPRESSSPFKTATDFPRTAAESWRYFTTLRKRSWYPDCDGLCWATSIPYSTLFHVLSRSSTKLTDLSIARRGFKPRVHVKRCPCKTNLVNSKALPVSVWCLFSGIKTLQQAKVLKLIHTMNWKLISIKVARRNTYKRLTRDTVTVIDVVAWLKSKVTREIIVHFGFSDGLCAFSDGSCALRHRTLNKYAILHHYQQYCVFHVYYNMHAYTLIHKCMSTSRS